MKIALNPEIAQFMVPILFGGLGLLFAIIGFIFILKFIKNIYIMRKTKTDPNCIMVDAVLVD